MSEIIDINISQTVEEITIIATPTNYIVNINKIEAGSAVTSVNGLTGAVVIPIPDAQVNSDWNATSGKAQILNKPTIPSISGLATTTYVDAQDSLKVDKITGYSLTKNDLTNALKTAYDNLVTWVSTNGTNLISHLTNYSNPHQTTASQIGAYTTTQVDNLLVNVNTNSVRKDTVKLATAINKGQAVYVSSADGTNIVVTKASNTSEATSSKTIGLLETSGATNAIVNVVTDGLLTGLNTSTATIGDPIWLGTNGDLIYSLVNKPFAPSHLVYVGVVTRAHAVNGEILVKVQNGFELKEIHDVAIVSPINEDFLQYETSTSLWKNIQITASWLRSKLGITTLSGSNTGDQDISGKLNKSGDTITGDIGNTATGYFRIAIGTTAQRPSTALDGMRRYNTTTLRDEFYANGSWQNHARLTGDNFTGVITSTNLSGTNTGDETQTTILSKLGFTPIKSIIKDTVQGSTITGVTTETLTGTYLIPANTFATNDIMKITSFLAEKTGTAGNCTMRVKVGTTNVFSSSTQIALYQFTSTFLTVNLQRFSIILRNSNLRTFPNLSNINDFSVNATVYSNISFNPAIDNYIFTSLQLVSATDSVFQSNFIITN
jgi:hypothetical protein